KIADVPVPDDDPSTPVVADVTVGDVDLVQIDVVEEEADPPILVEMEVGKGHVAIALVKANAVAAPAHCDLRDDRLDSAIQLDPAGLGVIAENLDARDEGHALIPSRGEKGLGRGRAFVGTDQTDGGTGAIHHQRDRPL